MSGRGAPDPAGGARPGMRLDKWLWHARFFKTRTLAGTAAGGGRVRVNRVPVAKPGQTVRVGDVLTFPQGHHVRVIEIRALSDRRGPASEAQALYRDLDPPQPRADADGKASTPAPAAKREPGAGRPTKRERRQLDRLKPNPDDPTL
ncbi:RNA-binding S4 domain-containing protein [Marivibrio halodurans]|uniref:RNA-binding S4 domain-containing protein n=1 Tax=Marivibrio halodurans TaxID=2039722 RepID=A0A8J7V349_9PROT|nr:RNA-binding S4 domain-containing protein [Marivibrio halodurans]MBP5858015.1 RNA-binding S4 domain-containing protein [Marivibrio halodurans]